MVIIYILAEIPDPRRYKAQHDLTDVLFVALAAGLCGAGPGGLPRRLHALHGGVRHPRQGRLTHTILPPGNSGRFSSTS